MKIQQKGIAKEGWFKKSRAWKKYRKLAQVLWCNTIECWWLS